MSPRKPVSKKSAEQTDKASAARRDAAKQLDSFLAKYDPEIASFSRQALLEMRRIVPGAIEMVYDNYNALVIGFGPSERPSEAIFSIVLYPRYVSLCFLQGAGLPDPDGLLQGGGNLVRHIRLFNAGARDPKRLNDEAILALVNTAINRAKVSMPPQSRRKLIIRSVSKKQRPRRPAPK